MLARLDRGLASFADRHMELRQAHFHAFATIIEQIASDTLQIGGWCWKRALSHRSHETDKGFLDKVSWIIAVSKPRPKEASKARAFGSIYLFQAEGWGDGRIFRGLGLPRLTPWQRSAVGT